MDWLVTGASGMLGTDLCRGLERRGISVTAVDRGDLDLLDPVAVAVAVAAHDVVVNCAAWTAVDAAENHEEEAAAINAVAPGVLARAAAEHDRLIVQVSTDYVFDGTARSPYDEDAPLGPRSAYGRTKAAGEQAVRAAAPGNHLVVRTAWLYGAHGSCFPRTIARLAREQGRLRVVDDQVGQPTWTVDVAELICRLVEAEAPAGTWHATSAGETSWFGFARRVVDEAAGRRTSSGRPRPPTRQSGPDVLGPTGGRTRCWGTGSCTPTASRRSVPARTVGRKQPQRCSVSRSSSR